MTPHDARWPWRDAWLHDRQVRGSVRILLFAISAAKSSRGGVYSEGHTWLASACGIRARALRDSLSRAEAMGWIRRAGRAADGSLWELSQPDGEKKKRQDPAAQAGPAGTLRRQKPAAQRQKPAAGSGRNLPLRRQKPAAQRQKPAAGSGRNLPLRRQKPAAPEAETCRSGGRNLPAHLFVQESKESKQQGEVAGQGNPEGPLAQATSAAASFHPCSEEDLIRQAVEIRVADLQAQGKARNPAGLRARLLGTLTAEEARRILNPPPKAEDPSERLARHLEREAESPSWLVPLYGEDAQARRSARREQALREAEATAAKLGLPQPLTHSGPSQGPADRQEILGAALDRLEGEPCGLGAAQVPASEGLTPVAPGASAKRRTQSPVESRSGCQDPGRRAGDFKPAGARSARLRGHCSGSTPGGEEVARG